MNLGPIQPPDNAAMARIIRTVMPGFDCVGEGFSILDPEVGDIAGAYAGERCAFYVVGGGAAGAIPVEKAGEGQSILGGGGFAPLTGSDGNRVRTPQNVRPPQRARVRGRPPADG